jgi:hypothetical protein
VVVIGAGGEGLIVKLSASAFTVRKVTAARTLQHKTILRFNRFMASPQRSPCNQGYRLRPSYTMWSCQNSKKI